MTNFGNLFQVCKDFYELVWSYIDNPLVLRCFLIILIMIKQSKVGDIVQDGTFVSSITKIDGETVILAKNYETKLEKLVPVEIRGGFDNRIVLENIISVRASIIAPGLGLPRRKQNPYIECDIEGRTIVSIIETNGFNYIHELQNWLLDNAPDYYLMKI